MWAAAEGHTAVVRALIDAGADINATLDSGFTPFFFAVREGHIDVVRVFLEAGVDVNATMQRPRSSPARPPHAQAGRQGHEPVAARGAERSLRARDRAGRRGRRSKRSSGQDSLPLHTLTWVRKPDSSDVSDPAPPIGSGRLTSLEFVREIVKRGANVNLRLPKGAPKEPDTSSRIEH